MIKISSQKNPIEVILPGGKSIINRILILATYSHRKVKIENLNYCDDVLDLINNLKLLGAQIHLQGDAIEFISGLQYSQNTGKNFNLNLGSGGTTIRFILPLLAYLGGNYTIDVNADFKSRPMVELFGVLEQLGCLFSSKSFPLNFEAKLIPGLSLNVDCSQTSQFYSGLLMLSAYFDLKVNPHNLSTSLKFVENTKILINEFKAGVDTFTIAPDATSYSYALAYGLTIEKVIIKNFDLINFDDGQSDWEITKFFPKPSNFEILPKEFPSFSIDISQCLDLFPTLVYLASCANGKSLITGTNNLKYKESNRLDECVKILNFYEITYELSRDSIEILGTTRIINKFFEYIAPTDHRMVVISFLFMKRHFGGTISNENFVKKSFPNFFKYFNK